MLTVGTFLGYCWAADLSAEIGSLFSSRLLAQTAVSHTHCSSQAHTHHLTRLAKPGGALNSERAANTRRDTCRWITFPEYTHAAPVVRRPPVTKQRLSASLLHTHSLSKGELCQCCQIGFEVWSSPEVLLKIDKYDLWLTVPINW